jgi:hypothetical protein
MENLRNSILTCLIDRAPNSLTSKNIFGLIPTADIKAIEGELDAMVAEGALLVRSGARSRDYLLPTYDAIPIKEFVNINGVKLPRFIAGDTVRPEDVNIFFEALAHRLLEIESTAERKIDERMKSYWGNVIVLFGAFIGVFSLIVGFVKTIPLAEDATFMSVLSVGTAQVIPFGIILAGFVWFLKSQFK